MPWECLVNELWKPPVSTRPMQSSLVTTSNFNAKLFAVGLEMYVSELIRPFSSSPPSSLPSLPSSSSQPRSQSLAVANHGIHARLLTECQAASTNWFLKRREELFNLFLAISLPGDISERKNMNEIKKRRGFAVVTGTRITCFRAWESEQWGFCFVSEALSPNSLPQKASSSEVIFLSFGLYSLAVFSPKQLSF